MRVYPWFQFYPRHDLEGTPCMLHVTATLPDGSAHEVGIVLPQYEGFVDARRLASAVEAVGAALRRLAAQTEKEQEIVERSNI